MCVGQVRIPQRLLAYDRLGLGVVEAQPYPCQSYPCQSLPGLEQASTCGLKVRAAQSPAARQDRSSWAEVGHMAGRAWGGWSRFGLAMRAISPGRRAGLARSSEKGKQAISSQLMTTPNKFMVKAKALSPSGSDSTRS